MKNEPGWNNVSEQLKEIRLTGRRSKSRELYEYLRQAMLDGLLQPGDRLVEEQIASLASVSRTPVREALSKLEAEGLVQSAPRGAIVTIATTEELVDLCVVRETLEGLAARLASSYRSELEVATMTRIHEEYEEATMVGDVSRLVQLNNSFHEALWAGARNRYLMSQLRRVRSLIQRTQPTTLVLPNRRTEALQEHEALLAAITAKDGDRAEEVMKMHVRRAISIRMAQLKMHSEED